MTKNKTNRNKTRRNRTKRNRTKRSLSGGSSPEIIFLSSGSDEPEPELLPEPVLQFEDVEGDLYKDSYGCAPYNPPSHPSIYENDYNSPEVLEFINYTMAPRRPKMSFASAMKHRQQKQQREQQAARADRAMASARNAMLNPRRRRRASAAPSVAPPPSVRQRILQGLYDMFLSNRTPDNRPHHISRNRLARSKYGLDGGNSKRRSKKRTKKR